MLGVLYRCIINNCQRYPQCILEISHLLTRIVFSLLQIQSEQLGACSHKKKQLSLGNCSRIFVPPPINTEDWLYEWLYDLKRPKCFADMKEMLYGAIYQLKIKTNCDRILMPFEILLSIALAQQIHCFATHTLMTWAQLLHVRLSYVSFMSFHETASIRYYLQENYEESLCEGGFLYTKKLNELPSPASCKHKNAPIQSKHTLHSYDFSNSTFARFFDPFILTEKDLYPIVKAKIKCKRQNIEMQIQDKSLCVSQATIDGSQMHIYAQFVAAREYLSNGAAGVSPHGFFSDPQKETMRMLSEISKV